ncbi:MAG TPA: ComEC/Rec2 family competence protein [Candidatus Saccharimonadales bacterium]|nr:ComEC/Rec2 family competence protein [Candidatus Saccharimonadales bacterium]
MVRAWRYRFRRTTLSLFFCLSGLIGIGFAHKWQLLIGAWLGFIAFGLLVLGRRRNFLSLLIVVLFGIGLGFWRGTEFLVRINAYQPLYFQKLTLNVRATEDAVYGKNSQLTFGGSDVYLENGAHLTGKLIISGFGENAIFQGDEVTVTGKLYPGYGIYQGKISYGQISVTAHHQALVSNIRRRFAAGMQTALPEPLAPFAMGLLIGQRATLPDDIKRDLLMVGLTHIIAVSGYNLTIILQASRKLLAKQSKRLSTLLSVCLIGTFLLLAGASASIVRAAIVSMLSIAAGYYGRSFRPLNLLAIAALITAWANPVYIWSDLSWYLSFLAFFGVMIIAPLIQNRWSHGWHQTLIGSVALESICAELMSVPFVLYIFGQMSFIGLPANVLVVTLVPLAMLLGVIAGLAGMMLGSISGWIAWPAQVLLNYMLDVAHILSHIPHIFVQDIGFPLSNMLGIYILILLLAFVLWRKTNNNNSDIITDMKLPKTEKLST